MNQGSPEWLAARAGHCTASRFADVMAKGKTGEAVTRIRYRWQLITERLTGLPVEGYKNRAMERGQEMEPFARLAYESETGNFVEEVGFLPHPAVALVGCSPDGLIEADGAVEIKCPDNPTVHVQTLHGGMPSEHWPQVQGVLWVTSRKWLDFVSYDPRMPEALRLYVQRIQRDDAYIASLAAEVEKFQADVERQLQSLITLSGGKSCLLSN